MHLAKALLSVSLFHRCRADEPPILQVSAESQSPLPRYLVGASHESAVGCDVEAGRVACSLVDVTNKTPIASSKTYFGVTTSSSLFLEGPLDRDSVALCFEVVGGATPQTRCLMLRAERGSLVTGSSASLPVALNKPAGCAVAISAGLLCSQSSGDASSLSVELGCLVVRYNDAKAEVEVGAPKAIAAVAPAKAEVVQTALDEAVLCYIPASGLGLACRQVGTEGMSPSAGPEALATGEYDVVKFYTLAPLAANEALLCYGASVLPQPKAATCLTVSVRGSSVVFGSDMWELSGGFRFLGNYADAPDVRNVDAAKVADGAAVACVLANRMSCSALALKQDGSLSYLQTVALDVIRGFNAFDAGAVKVAEVGESRVVVNTPFGSRILTFTAPEDGGQPTSRTPSQGPNWAIWLTLLGIACLVLVVFLVRHLWNQGPKAGKSQRQTRALKLPEAEEEKPLAPLARAAPTPTVQLAQGSQPGAVYVVSPQVITTTPVYYTQAVPMQLQQSVPVVYQHVL